MWSAGFDLLDICSSSRQIKRVSQTLMCNSSLLGLANQKSSPKDSTMQLYHLAIMYKPPEGHPRCLRFASDLSSFPFYKRYRIGKYFRHKSTEAAQRIKLDGAWLMCRPAFVCHVTLGEGEESLVGILISDHSYPDDVAQLVLKKVLAKFTKDVPSWWWPGLAKNDAPFSKLDMYLKKYQDSNEINSMKLFKLNWKFGVKMKIEVGKKSSPGFWQRLQQIKRRLLD